MSWSTHVSVLHCFLDIAIRLASVTRDCRARVQCIQQLTSLQCTRSTWQCLSTSVSLRQFTYSCNCQHMISYVVANRYYIFLDIGLRKLCKNWTDLEGHSRSSTKALYCSMDHLWLNIYVTWYNYVIKFHRHGGVSICLLIRRSRDLEWPWTSVFQFQHHTKIAVHARLSTVLIGFIQTRDAL